MDPLKYNNKNLLKTTTKALKRQKRLMHALVSETRCTCNYCTNNNLQKCYSLINIAPLKHYQLQKSGSLELIHYYILLHSSIPWHLFSCLSTSFCRCGLKSKRDKTNGSLKGTDLFSNRFYPMLQLNLLRFCNYQMCQPLRLNEQRQ